MFQSKYEIKLFSKANTLARNMFVNVKYCLLLLEYWIDSINIQANIVHTVAHHDYTSNLNDASLAGDQAYFKFVIKFKLNLIYVQP